MKTPIEIYLYDTGLSRSDLITLMAAKGWRPSTSTLSRWINGKRCPGPAAQVMLSDVSGGRIVYGGGRS